jgi:hypothetical protein
MKKELTEYSKTFYEKFTTSSSINEMWLDLIIIGFSTALFVLLLDVFVTVPVFFVVCVSCFPIGPFLSAGQPTNVSRLSKARNVMAQEWLH